MNANHSARFNPRMIFTSFLTFLAILAISLPATGSASAQEPAPWRDDFDGSLAEGWEWLNQNPDMWNLTENPGFLRMYNAHSPMENLLLRPVAQGDFAMETRLFFEPNANFQFAGLIIYQDDGNYLAFGRAFCDVEGSCVGNGIYFDHVAGGEWVDGNFATQIDNPFNPAEAYLRLERRGNMVRALYSHEGITWIEIGTHWISPDFQIYGVGLVANQDYFASGLNVFADFDYFELTEGWGFLPEGFHDYDEGDVPSWACNVGGWAADPDDRSADLAIEVGIDDAALPEWLYASEYREDLDTAGVCVDGTCSFSASLWDVVTSYEPHSVVVYAQDIPTGDWVRLSNSPEPLTCRTYDIYAYDPLTGETKQITNLRDTGEFNPSWSPNGKLVAHDVVYPDGSNSIFVTDVWTGISTPLIGAENGGNDAVWSPNGKSIAFDRIESDTPALYIVPSGGGTATLVRSDAVSADWAPSGKRLVFHQPSDGSLRTVAVESGKGDETIIAPGGENPAWSPDGSWIAYEYNGDIWKVQVNILGKTFGDPIQLTGGPRWDGQPSWSSDSATIVFHAGTMSDDFDLWTIPAAGGMATWLNGAVVFGDYDPSYAKNGPEIGYASFSPESQAARNWVTTFSYDLPGGYWTEGWHVYHFEADGEAGNDLWFNVSASADLYEGFVLLRPWYLRAQTAGTCQNIDTIHPDQQTRFHIGYTDDGVTYAEAAVDFETMDARVVWDDVQSAGLVRHEIIPFTWPFDWQGYICQFTTP